MYKQITADHGSWFRTTLIFIAFLLGAVVLAAHLFFLQFNPSINQYYKNSVAQRWESHEIPKGRRGDILFRDGSVIACNRKTARVMVDPNLSSKVSKTAWMIGKSIEEKPKYIESLIDTCNSQTERILTDIEEEAAKKIAALNLPGVYLDFHAVEEGTLVADLIIEPNMLEKVSALGYLLGEKLEMDGQVIDQMVAEHKGSGVKVAECIPLETALAIDRLNLRGVYTYYDYQRYYPHGSYGAAATVGYVHPRSKDRTGLEKSFDCWLTGKDGRVSFRKDASRKKLPGSIISEIPKEDGSPLLTSLDQSIQMICEDELRNASLEHNPEWATIIVMDPYTGEVLGVATNPTFDPNEYSKGNIGPEYNVLTQRTVEPGSTVKPLLTAYSMERGWLDPAQLFVCNQPISVDGKVLREAEPNHYIPGAGGVSVAEIIIRSSNVGMAKIAMQLGQDRVIESYKQFGFFQKTGVEQPMERSGTKPFHYEQLLAEKNGINKECEWPKRVLANAGFGQGFSTTPLQIAAAYSVIANGGYQVKPTLIARSTSDGVAVSENPVLALPGDERLVQDEHDINLVIDSTKPGPRVLSEDTCELVTDWLSQVVSCGTGKNAQLARTNIKAAGKTGTGQIAAEKGGYKKQAYTASFAGFFPVENPKYVVVTMFVHPKAGKYYGGSVAAPVFKKVCDRISYLDQLDLEGVDCAAR